MNHDQQQGRAIPAYMQSTLSSSVTSPGTHHGYSTPTNPPAYLSQRREVSPSPSEELLFPSVPQTAPPSAGLSYQSLISSQRPMGPPPRAPPTGGGNPPPSPSPSASTPAYLSGHLAPQYALPQAPIPSYLSEKPGVGTFPSAPSSSPGAYSSGSSLGFSSAPVAPYEESTPSLGGMAAPSAYQSPGGVEEERVAVSDLEQLYQSSHQGDYASTVHQDTIIVSDLREFEMPDIQATRNEDGSTEGWLWQQRDTGDWDRLYFILDEHKLLGFRHYPKVGGDAAPIQGLPLVPGMVVTPHFSANYLGVRGFCFAIQVQPQSEQLVVFDTVSARDRALWVEVLEDATRASEVNAWMPWEMERRGAELQKQQELRQQQREEEEQLRLAGEAALQQQLETIKQQEIAKISDSHLATQITEQYEQERTLMSLEEALSRLHQEIEHFTLLREQVSTSTSLSPEARDTHLQSIAHALQRREAQIQQLEADRQQQREEQARATLHEQAEELRRLKEEQALLLQREEARIRAELQAHYEQEIECRRQEQEKALQAEKKRVREQIVADERAQVLQWLEDNPSWVDYYRHIGVTEEELSDFRCVKRLIRDTAQFVIQSDVPATTVSHSDPTSISSPPSTSEPLDGPHTAPPSTSEVPSHKEDPELPPSSPPEFSEMVPDRPPPPPPEDSDEEDVPDLDVPARPDHAPPPPPPELASVPSGQSPPPAPPAPPVVPVSSAPPAPGPPPPPVSTPTQPQVSMMDQIHSFHFQDSHNKEHTPRPPLQKEESLLDQIHSFKFKDRKRVIQPKQLPKQNQDSLTEILAAQLSTFRSKMRVDKNDDEYSDDDDWD